MRKKGNRRTASYQALGIDSFEEGARENLGNVLIQTFGDAVPASVSARLVQGQAAKSLPHIAEGARMLVVGRRGHGGLLGLLLGSVSSAVVNHPPVPVLLVK